MQRTMKPDDIRTRPASRWPELRRPAHARNRARGALSVRGSGRGFPVRPRVARGFAPRTRSGPDKRLGDLGSARIEDMDRAGITMQILSCFGPGPDLMEGAEAVALAREMNGQARLGHCETPIALEASRICRSETPRARRKSFAARFGSSVSAALSSMARRRTDFLMILVSRPSCQRRKSFTRRSISIRIFHPKPCARPISRDFRAPREVNSWGRAGDGTRKPLYTFCGWSWRERSTGIRS